MRFFWLLCALTFLIGCGSDNQENKVPLKIGTNLWPGYEMLYLAEYKGYFEADKVNVVQHASASEVMSALLSNQINAAGLTLDEALQVWDKGHAIEIILVTDVSDGGDMLLTKPEITEVYDLKGKVLGLEDSALGAYMLERFLQFSGLKTGDFTTKTLTIDQHSAAFASGDVDAVITFDPQAAKIKATGANLLFSSRDIPNEIIDVIVVSSGANKPSYENIQHLINGYYAALSDFQQKSPDDISFISQRLGISEQDTQDAYKQLKLPSKDESLALMSLGGVMINSLNYMSFILEKSKIIQEGCQCREIINIDYLGQTVSKEE